MASTHELSGGEGKELSGRQLAQMWRARTEARVAHLQSEGVQPELAIVVDKSTPQTEMYVRLKSKVANSMGMAIREVRPNGQTHDTIAAISKLGADRNVHGVILQLPVKKPEVTDAMLAAIHPVKDVDGLNPESTRFQPATPMAILELLSGNGIDLKDERVALLGQGKLVGEPLARHFQSEGIWFEAFDEHSDRLDVVRGVHDASVIISGMGLPGAIDAELLRGASTKIIVDAGTAEDGGVVLGDVDPSVRTMPGMLVSAEKGGVGPLTIQALLHNVTEAAASMNGIELPEEHLEPTMF